MPLTVASMVYGGDLRVATRKVTVSDLPSVTFPITILIHTIHPRKLWQLALRNPDCGKIVRVLCACVQKVGAQDTSRDLSDIAVFFPTMLDQSPMDHPRPQKQDEEPGE